MIKATRRAKGITQKEFANMLNVSQSYISKIENRKQVNVTIDVIINISIILNLCPAVVMFSILDYYPCHYCPYKQL